MFSAPAATTTAPARTVWRSPRRRRTRRRSPRPPSISDALDGRVRAQLEQPARPARRRCTCSSSTCRRSSGSPGGTSRSACSSRRCTSVTGSSSAPSARKPGSSVCTHCCQSLRSRTPSALLDAVVVRLEVGDGERLAAARSSARSPACHLATSRSCARSATFVLIVVVPPTQRPARNATTSPPGSGAKRSGHQRSWVAFASQRVKSAAVRCGPHLEQQHVAAALRELARDDAAARAGARRRRRRSGPSCDPQVRPVLARGASRAAS